jgi:hypothetical protein
MGINAQTSVPKFTIGDVLTAANTNLLTNAPPVFAGTATRDAAFGGAGEKTLAEGQLCYLEDSNIVQYYDGAAWATVGPTASKIAQVLQTTSTTATSTTSTSYVTTTLNLAITPTLNTSKVLVLATLPVYISNGNGAGVYTIFRGTVAGTNLFTATGFAKHYSTPNQTQISVAGNFLDSPATTSATTYTVGFKVEINTTTATAQISDTSSSLTLIEVLA